jgi:hypothetical protein
MRDILGGCSQPLHSSSFGTTGWNLRRVWTRRGRFSWRLPPIIALEFHHRATMSRSTPGEICSSALDLEPLPLKIRWQN